MRNTSLLWEEPFRVVRHVYLMLLVCDKLWKSLSMLRELGSLVSVLYSGLIFVYIPCSLTYVHFLD